MRLCGWGSWLSYVLGWLEGRGSSALRSLPVLSLSASRQTTPACPSRRGGWRACERQEGTDILAMASDDRFPVTTGSEGKLRYSADRSHRHDGAHSR